ncbi:MAG: UvrD-helicase domain-containing protein [Planctomycetes bacterium]|nr:UvrD-helicase domain-containing protein [Planctomycetota bacterium]
MSRPRGALVVLASAGTGKTWSLTTHFLRLVAAGVPPERCLATTFTRKAAGEILDRIFARLVAAARDEHERAELDRALEGGLATRDAAADLLVALARRVDRCRVMTIDAFFVVLARALAAELGVPADWGIADEFHEGRARETAVGRALEQGTTGHWILLLRELERAHAKRAVHSTLVDRVRDAHELFLEAPESAWSALRAPAKLSDAERESLARRLAELPVPVTQKKTPSKTWEKELAKLRVRLATGDWDEFGRGGLAAKILEDAETYSDFEISGATRGVVGELLCAAAADQGAMVERQNRATQALISDFDRELRRLLDERGLLRFSDLPRVLARSKDADAGPESAAERLAELAWRLDSELDHLLLDEFQDTSPAQWRVLAPFAEELASDGSGEKSFFCVGDTKQSIYGWRGGDPRLLEGVARWPTVERESLTKSWRSAPVVLDAVNAVFESLTTHPVFSADPERLPAAHNFVFERHSSAKPKLRGVVRAVFARVPDGADADGRRRACLEAAVERVVELSKTAPRATIGVLVRRKAQVGTLVYLLRQRALAASGESGNPLTDARFVQVVLSLLHLAEHPADTAARFHVVHSTLGAHVGLAPDADDATVVRRARALRGELVERGFAATLEGFRPACAELDEWERRRFERLIELAITWEVEPALSPGEFVARVRDERVEDPSSAAIKVMTIHAAKGLEFDAVVLPELVHEFGHVPPALVWRRAGEDPTREIEAISRGAAKELRAVLAYAGEPLLDELHGATRTRGFYDELCALYVALTRARRELVLVLGPISSAKPTFSGGGIVAMALGLADREPGAPDWLAEGSDPGWVEDFRAAGPDAEAPQPTDAARVVFGRASTGRDRTSPSRAAAARNTPLRLLFADAGPARLRGSRLHAWLEQVEWLDAFRASDAELVELARARDLAGEGLERDLADFRRLLATAEARAVLARPERECEAWRERRYLLPSDPGAPSATSESVPGAPSATSVSLLGAPSEFGVPERGVFDRVVVERVAGRAVRARIVDFKSDAGLDDETRLAERVRHHAPQLLAYRAALARILELDARAISAELWFLEAGAVRAVE